jgi:hypothetical protein
MTERDNIIYSQPFDGGDIKIKSGKMLFAFSNVHHKTVLPYPSDEAYVLVRPHFRGDFSK